MLIVTVSAAGSTASDIAGPLHYDPKPVHTRIRRHHDEGLTGLPDRPAPDGPA